MGGWGDGETEGRGRAIRNPRSGIRHRPYRVALAGDRCDQPGCVGIYEEMHGIEVGHIFKLGTKYSRDMRAQVQTETGENRDVIMGCYGLGISRTMAAAVEAHNDGDGVRWP